jgi:hypothetical protein
MKRILGMALAATLAATPIALEAQQGGYYSNMGQMRNPGDRVFEVVMAHRNELQLTDAQVSRIDAIRQRLEAQNRPLYQQLDAMGGAGPWGAFGAMGGQGRPITPEEAEELRRQMEEVARGAGAAQGQAGQAQNRGRQAGAARQGQGAAARGAAPGQAGRQGANAAGRPGANNEAMAVRRQIQENNRAAAEEALAVLTPEQQARARQLVEERRARAAERQGALIERAGQPGRAGGQAAPAPARRPGGGLLRGNPRP